MLRTVFTCLTLSLASQAAYIRVNQIGYEAGEPLHRAYLMSTSAESGVFHVLNGEKKAVYTAAVGRLLGHWSKYNVYALDFNVRECGRYSIAVANAKSPVFAIDEPARLYAGLLLNSKFFYETQRDGPDFKPNALRSAPGHLNDRHATAYETPILDSDDNIATTGHPLSATGATIDASGGWWDAGDYMKYVETVSYTVALQQIGIRDFPDQIGRYASVNPPRPPASISYAGDAAGAPSSADFTDEADFGTQFLLRMWDDKSKTLYYQVGNSQDWANFPDLLSDYDIWRLPQADDDWDGCSAGAKFICHRPVFRAGKPGSKISPNLAGRLAADFAGCYLLNRASHPGLATRCLKNAEDIFKLADTSLADPAASVDSGSCATGCLQTIIPFDGYPETVWDDDMELGATELYFALRAAHKEEAAAHYLAQAAHFAHNYITKIYQTGSADTLNLYDVSGLAHFELYRALRDACSPTGLEVTAAGIRTQLLKQVDDAIAHAKTDPWDFGAGWSDDTTSHGAGISVMASEAFYLTGHHEYDVYSQRWMANILGANAWGSSFLVGDGSATFPNCIQHQVANLAGALDGTTGGTPVLWGAASEGPAYGATSGALDGMLFCPADGSDRFAKFNGNGSVYQDNVQSYSTTEPAIDLTASSFLMWSWRMAKAPSIFAERPY